MQRLQSGRSSNKDLKKQDSQKSSNSGKGESKEPEKRKSDKLIANVLKDQAKMNKHTGGSSNSNEVKKEVNRPSSNSKNINTGNTANNSITSTDIPDENVSQKKKDLKV